MPSSDQCVSCIHYDYANLCAAFPAGIPEEIMDGTFDHRRPYPGDQGIRWEPMPGYTLPDDEETDA